MFPRCTLGIEDRDGSRQQQGAGEQHGRQPTDFDHRIRQWPLLLAPRIGIIVREPSWCDRGRMGPLRRMRALTLTLTCLLALAFAAETSAATLHRSYNASFSASRGTATLSIYTNRTASVALSVKSMTAGTWTVALYKGTRASLSTKIVTLAGLRVPSGGRATRTYSVSESVAERMCGSRVAVKLTLGSRSTCASFATVSLPGVSVSPATPSNCQAGYSPCLPIVDDLDCADVRAMGKAPVRVTGSDPYRLDRDGDGIGCE